jgi:Fur family ferric uptake transcriptional regulator
LEAHPRKPLSGEDFLNAFRAYLRKEGLKCTRQRDIIATEFSRVRGHVSVEELLGKVRDRSHALGYATVYRTLKLLVDAGLAEVRNFGEGFARYEPLDRHHHEHLICESCGRIVEFHDELLETYQDEVAAGLGYRVTHHRHDLFGVCEACLRSGVDPEALGTDRGGARGTELPEAFRRFLGRRGMRVTRQRMTIVEIFAGVEDHVSVDDLLIRVQKHDRSIGYATVYRTLKLLVEAGLASTRQFGDGFTRFEPHPEEHHDHLVDEERGVVLEFHDPRIESRQEEIARANGFRLTRHRHDLFGIRMSTGKTRP